MIHITNTFKAKIIRMTQEKEQIEAELNVRKIETNELQIQLTESTRKNENLSIDYALEECNLALRGQF